MNTNVQALIPLDDLEANLLDALATVSQAEHRFLTLLNEFDWRQGWKEYGNTDCAGWLVWRCKISRGTAIEKLRVARALWRLPQIDAAFAKGQLSYSQVRAVTRVADQDNETALLNYALDRSADQLERYCSRLRNTDPEHAAALAQRQHEGRSLTKSVKPDGSGTLVVELPAAQLQLVMAAVEKVGALLGEDPDRSVFARDADALVALAQAHLSGEALLRGEARQHKDGTRQTSSSAGYEVVIHVDAEALSEAPSAESGSDVPLPVVKRLCCDGAFRVMMEENGSPIDVGRRRRTVPTALKRAVQARDVHCQFPGCHHQRFVDIHHIQHWADGGETNLTNLALLCGHHHTLLHEGGFSMARNADGSLRFRRPDGRVLNAGFQRKVSLRQSVPL